MSEVRRDPITDAWVIMAPGRDTRPEEFIEGALPSGSSFACPFCAGNEHLTPPAVFCLDGEAREGRDGVSDWSVRVVPNKYPAVANERRRTFTAAHPLFEAMPLSGAHEVVIESPEHATSLSELPVPHVTNVLRAYVARLRYWLNQQAIQYAILFKNVGAAAGASLSHSHSQLVATSLLPPSIVAMAHRFDAYRRDHGQCMMCHQVADELDRDQRVIARTDSFVAYCPFASRLPYLVRVAPLEHEDTFEDQSEASLEELGALVHRLVGLLEATHAPAAYNYVIHTRPNAVAGPASFHWWLELFPRLTKQAGFEWGSDCYINPVLPEVAARHLRNLETHAPLGCRMRDLSG